MYHTINLRLAVMVDGKVCFFVRYGKSMSVYGLSCSVVVAKGHTTSVAWVVVRPSLPWNTEKRKWQMGSELWLYYLWDNRFICCRFKQFGQDCRNRYPSITLSTPYKSCIPFPIVGDTKNFNLYHDLLIK